MNLTLMDLHLLAGADYVKSIEYSSELLRKISKIWEVLAWRNRYLSDGKTRIIGIISPCHTAILNVTPPVRTRKVPKTDFKPLSGLTTL